jgi:hypothetical protein
MRKPITVVAVLAIVAFVPNSAYAWGAVAHRFIMQRAIDLLPPEIKPFFEHYGDELVLRVNDPDLWRVAGFDEEVPNHQIDFGVDDYGPYPFTALPRDYDAAVQKFGVATVRRHGTLPWRVTEEFGNLRRTMEGFRRNQVYANGNAILFAAALAHYVQDAQQPLHVHNNYDGQLTGQTGLHSRFESELFERFETRLNLVPPPVQPVGSVRDFIFDIVLASYQLVPKILAADREAIAGGDTYDDAYFEAFLVKVKPVLEQQLSAAITATAAAITQAWRDAGQPPLQAVMKRPVQKVKTPK